jgi:hypothetical protein
MHRRQHPLRPRRNTGRELIQLHEQIQPLLVRHGAWVSLKQRFGRPVHTTHITSRV